MEDGKVSRYCKDSILCAELQDTVGIVLARESRLHKFHLYHFDFVSIFD